MAIDDGTKPSSIRLQVRGVRFKTCCSCEISVHNVHGNHLRNTDIYVGTSSVRPRHKKKIIYINCQRYHIENGK